MPNLTAPGELELVREFVNTYDAEFGTDELADSRKASGWLREHGLLPRDEAVSDTEARRLAATRETIRRLLVANNEGQEDRDALAALDRDAGRAALRVSFGGDGSAALVPTRRGASGVAGRLLGIVFGAISDDTWRRLKVCAADDCQWAFYDHSRNRSGTWCTMEGCGNRAKARAYRERHRARTRR